MQTFNRFKPLALVLFISLIATSGQAKPSAVEGNWEIQSHECVSGELSKSGKLLQLSTIKGDWHHSLKFEEAMLTSTITTRSSVHSSYCEAKSKQEVLINKKEIKRNYSEWELKNTYILTKEECKKSLNPQVIAVPKENLKYFMDKEGRLVVVHPQKDRRSEDHCEDGALKRLYIKNLYSSSSRKNLIFHEDLGWMKEPLAKGILIYKDSFKDLIQELFGKIKVKIHPHLETDSLVDNYWNQSSMPDLSTWMPNESTIVLPRCRSQSCSEKSWLWLDTKQKIGVLALIHKFDSEQKIAKEPQLVLAISEGNCAGIGKKILNLIRDWLVITGNQNIENFQCVDSKNSISSLDPAKIKYDLQ